MNNKEYWNDEQNNYCIMIATSTDQQEINNAFTALLPAFDKMYITILRRYFSGTIYSTNTTANEDLHSHLREKVYNGLLNNYDSTSSSFSYVQAIIKYGIIDILRNKKNQFNNRLSDIDNVDVSEDNEQHNNYSFELVVKDINNEIDKYQNMGKKELYLSYLSHIKDILLTDTTLPYHKYLFSAYISISLNKKVGCIYTTLISKKKEGISYHPFIKKKEFYNSNIEFNSIDELNNKLYDKYKIK